jgi:beta-hydroxylase
VCCGLADVLRNRRRTFSTLNRYFTGNGIVTWFLSPFNLVMDMLSLPFRNKGIYQLSDLPQPYQEEIKAVIDAAHQRDLVGLLEAKMVGQKRGMIFFKWYGKNVQTSVEVPEFHQQYRFIRTIGVSVFSKKQSTGKHYGPLRVTLRVLYNINTIDSRNVFIKVGNRTHYWQDEKLFIFDDTLQHQSCNESEGVRYCLFVDILRPGPFPRVTSAILSGVRFIISRFNYMFYRHWTFIK